MTNEEIRIAIAEACGAEFAKWGKDWMLLTTPSTTEPIRIKLNGRTLEQGKRDYISALPNYPECLNAMHGAVMSLPLKQWDNYELHLAVVVFGPHMRHTVRYQHFATTNATARQRAEAFLRTLNLWRE